MLRKVQGREGGGLAHNLELPSVLNGHFQTLPKTKGAMLSNAQASTVLFGGFCFRDQQSHSQENPIL